MKKSLLMLITGAAVAMLATGCGPTLQEILAQYESNLSTGTLENSIPILQKLSDNEGEDQLLWRLMVGNAYTILGRPQDAVKQFDGAEDIFSKNDKDSVFSKGSDGTMSILNNDKSFPYNGIGQDRIFCCFYKAVAYAEMKKPEASRTEFNRAMEHQENWLFERRKEIASAEEALEKAAQKKENQSKNNGNNDQDRNALVSNLLKNNQFLGLISKNCGFDLSKSGDIAKLRPNDYQNAYVTHFCGIFRYLNGDSARDYLRNAKDLAPQNRTVQADFSAVDKGTAASDDVWLYMEDGLCSFRKEIRLDLPLFLIPYANKYVLYAGMAFPVLTPRTIGAKTYEIKTGSATTMMEELENIDRLIKTEYDVYMHSAVKRELTRCLVKVGAQVACGIAAEKVSNNYAQIGMKAAQLAAAGWARSTTAADIRSWTSLPKRVLVAHVKRPSDGKITLSVDGKKALIILPKGNTIVWMRKTAPLMPVRVKILSFPNGGNNVL